MRSPAIADARPLVAPAKPARSRALVIEQRTDLACPPADLTALETLIDARPQVGVFLTPAWLSGYFAEPPDRSDPCVLLMRQDGELRGMIPLAIRRTLTHAHVSLLGGGAGSDRVDLLAARGHEGACADRFMEWLESEFPRGYVLELRDVPGDSSLWGAIGRVTGERRPRVVLAPREVYALPYLPLQDSGPAPIDPDTAARHRRWLERKAHVRIETLTTPEDVSQAFDVLAGLLRARWGSGTSVLEIPRIQRFHRRVLPSLLCDKRLRMVRILGDMRPIAIFYGLANRLADAGLQVASPSHRWWGYYLAGYDREWAGRIHLGRVALAAAIDLAVKDGASEFDFLKGPERVKYCWPVRERITVDADIYSRGLGPRLTRATRAARNAIGALLRSQYDFF